MNLQVLGSKVALSAQEHLNVLGSGIENRGKVGRGHLCDLTGVDVKSLSTAVCCRILEKMTLKVEIRDGGKNKFAISWLALIAFAALVARLEA